LEIPAKVVYVDPAARERANCRARLERVLPQVRCDDVREMGPADYAAARQIGSRRHGKDDFGDETVVVFTTFDDARLDWFYHLRAGERLIAKRGEYCQTALELNIVEGCVFRCAYCGFGRRLIFYLDVERLIGGLDDIFAQYPDQSLYKYSNMTDLPPFEPELDAVPPMVARFAREADRYLMLFTKSDNVDFLLDLDHRGHTIVSWSITCDTASRAIDKRTPSMAERIAAMQAVQGAGYRVRARLSPIVPVKGWREEYRDLFERLFAAARPDVVTLELLGWFDFEDLGQLMPPDLLDGEAVAAARAAADALRGHHNGPFTEATHQEVYRFCIETVKDLSPETPVAVCHGTPETWSALGPLMGMAPTDYVCNCGPTSTPVDARIR